MLPTTVRVTYDTASATLYLDLDPRAQRSRRLLPDHHNVAVDLDRRSHAVGLGIVLTGDRRLPPGACAALLRYCPQLVGDSLRPNWDTIRDELMTLAGAGPGGPGPATDGAG